MITKIMSGRIRPGFGIKLHKFIVAILIIYSVFFNNLPTVNACGPSYLEPIFEFSNAPERPWTDFASGKLGIIKPTHRKIVLFAAYRYLKGGGFSQTEQKDLIDVWDADFNYKDNGETDITDAVKLWLKERKSVIKNEEKLPAIYTERDYGGGYDYFPNCTKNAFEVAAETLENRSSNSEKDVQEWINGQDKVFANCASGSELPRELGQDSPEWLVKDREYQIAAALFYSTKFDDARQRFEKIAEDSDSPWKETADYLVARTLIREASVGTQNGDGEDKPNPKANQLYGAAEQRLNLVMSRSTKFSESATKMLNLVKYRLRPEVRVRELAQSLEYQTPSLRQDLIDYSWLLDKLEADGLKPNKIDKQNVPEFAPEEIKINVEMALQAKGLVNVTVDVSTTYVTIRGTVPKDRLPDAVQIALSSGNGKPVKNEVTETDELSSKPIVPQTMPIPRNLSEAELKEIKAQIENQQNLQNSLSILPSYLRDDELTDWLFTYQTDGEDAFLHALERYEQTSSDMWLMTALAKANTTSKDVSRLIKNAGKVSRDSVAFPTIAYHVARLLIAQNKQVEARKQIDDVLNSTLDLPISTRNAFAEQRLKLSETLDDFIKFALRKPFAFGYDDGYGEAQTIEQMIAEEKTYWNAENYPDKSKADYDAEVDERYASELVWQNRLFLDSKSVQSINEYFSTEVLLQLSSNKNLPDYWKNRLIPAIWTRAYLLKDEKTALQFAPEVVKLKPETEKLMLAFVNAKTPTEREFAGLNILIKIRDLTPYLEPGFEKEDVDEFNMWTDERWWCEETDGSYDENAESSQPSFKPSFLTAPQIGKAKLEREKVLKTKDATSYLTKRVFDWYKLSPTDKRLPEALYVVYSINQWTKYGCGDYSEDARNKAVRLLKTKFPKSNFTLKMLDEEAEKAREQAGN